MNWKWNLQEAEANYYHDVRKYHHDSFELGQLMKDFSNDYDYIIWQGSRMMVCEAQARISNELVTACKHIVRQLSWEDQVTFVMKHTKDQPYLINCLDEVQRSTVVLLS